MRVVLSIVVSTFLFPGIYGADYKGGETVEIRSGDTLTSNLFVGAQSIELQGYVEGSFFAGSQKNNITGEVNGNVLSGCQDLSIRGKVNGMVINCSENLLIDGEIGDDVIFFGSILRMTSRAHIKGNLYVGAGKLSLEYGKVDGWIRGGAGEVNLNLSVGDSVVLEAGNVKFGKNFKAPTGIKLILSKQLNEEETENLPSNIDIVIKPQKAFFQTFFFYWSLLTLFVTGLLIILLFPDFTRNLLDYAEKNTMRSLITGLIVLIATPFIIVILAVLVLTIPTSIILLVTYLILLYLSFVFAGLFVGDYILSIIHGELSTAGLIWALILGVIIILLLTEIPLIGWLFQIMIICVGMGSFMAYLMGLRKAQSTPV